MALKRDYNWKGFPAEYWRIVNVNIDFKSKETTVTVWLHKDRTARTEHPEEYLDEMNWVLDKIVTTRAGIYTELKKDEMFKDATDIIETGGD